MWTRKELKEQGKAAFRRNYWKSVLVAFIISLIVGGGAGVSSFSNGVNSASHVGNSTDSSISVTGYPEDTQITINGEEVNLSAEIANDLIEDLGEDGVVINMSEEDAQEFAQVLAGPAMGAAIGVMIFAALVAFVVVMAIILALNAFIINPFVVGGFRFFTKNLDEEANVSNLGYGFDNNYKNIAITMFFRDLYIILWTLLFIIPGIVKAYEYRMIPYLLAEDPTMTREQAFAISKEMMTGNKWKAFVLDLSFLGWHILSIFTLGILEIFWVQPYEYSTDAALYRRLLMERGNANYDAQAIPAEVTYTQENVNSDEL